MAGSWSKISGAGIAQGQIGLGPRGQAQGDAAEQAVAGLAIINSGAGQSIEDDGRKRDGLLAVLGDLLLQIFPVTAAAEFAAYF